MEDCPTCNQPIYNVRGAIADMVGLQKKARELELQNQELQRKLDRLRIAVKNYAPTPFEPHIRSCRCSTCDLDRAMQDSPDFRHPASEPMMNCQCGDVTHCGVCGRRAQGIW